MLSLQTLFIQFLGCEERRKPDHFERLTSGRISIAIA